MIPAARLAALVLLSTASLALAQQPSPPPPESPRFEIKRFAIEGNTLVPGEELAKLVGPFVGPNKSFADVQLAQDAVQEAYRQGGWGAVQVLLPEQELTDGVIRFRVIEGKLGKVTIQNTLFHDADNIRQSVPALKEGQTPNLGGIAKNLSIANENPSKRTTVVLRTSEKENEVDADVTVEDTKPTKVYVSADNSGDRNTGQSRVGLGYQNANLFNKDHVLTAQFVTSPENVDDVKIFGVGYHLPLYDWNGSADFVLGYSDVDSGTIQVGTSPSGLSVTGRGSIALARYNYYLKRLGEGYEQRLSLGLDYRDYNNQATFGNTGVNLVPDYTVRPVSLSYSGIWRGAEANGNVYASVYHNIPGGPDGEEGDFTANVACAAPPGPPCFGGRAGARDDYTLFRYGGQVTANLKWGVQARAAFNGQYTDDALVAGEQFGLGGIDSVRGFIQRIIADDKGYQGNLELYSPDVGKSFGTDKLFLRLLAFYDLGGLRRNKAQQGEETHRFLSSAGVGIQGSIGLASFRLNYAEPINRQSLTGDGIQRWQGSILVVF